MNSSAENQVTGVLGEALPLSVAAPPTAMVTVFMREYVSTSRWVSRDWRPAAILPASEPVPPELADCTAYNGMVLQLFRDEGENYALNLDAPDPRVFVLQRQLEDASGGIAADAPWEPVKITLSYGEGARWMDGGERVETLQMPQALRAWLSEFVALHYVPEKKERRRPQSFMKPQDRAKQ
jgi:hypothetical protein